jgi:hypothetical protein
MEEKDTAKTPDEWVSIVQERIKQAEDWENRRQILRQLNYYLGNQWIVWDSTGKKMVMAPSNPSEERVTHNIIKPKVMVKVAKQIKNRIKYDVVPDTNDQNRIEVAKAAKRFLDYWWNEQEMDRKSRDIHMQDGIKGWCALKVYFDPELGDDITPEPTEEDIESGNEPGEIHTGEVVARVIDPLLLYVDPAATTDEEIRWIIERKPRDLDYIREKYAKEVPADSNVDYMTTDLSPQTGYSNFQNQKRNYRMAMVDEMWVKPCRKYPNGLKVTIANNTILDVDENAGDMPYIIFVDIPIPSTVKGDAFIKDMLPIQRHINILKTSMATHAKRMGNSIWAVPHGSQVDEDDLTNEQGAIVYYNGAGPAPTRVSPPDLPPIYDRLIEFYMRDIDDMSGAREISQGRLPGGLDTYSGLQLMVEQENEKLAISSENYERGMKRALKRVLMLMKKHYTEERMAKILGPDNDIELVSFKGSDLSGGEDINIVQGSSLPEMKTAQQERIMTLWDKGAIVDRNGQPDSETFLRLLGMGDAEAVYEMKQLDENKAKTENRIFQQYADDPKVIKDLQQYQVEMQQYQAAVQQAQTAGFDPAQMGQAPQSPIQLPPVRDFQDHDTHVYFHNLFRKSSDYEKLPPEIQQLVDDHVNEHIQQLQAPIIAQQQEQQQQMMMQQQQQADMQAQDQTNQQAQQEEQIALQHRKLDIEAQKVKNQHDQTLLMAQLKGANK